MSNSKWIIAAAGGAALAAAGLYFLSSDGDGSTGIKFDAKTHDLQLFKNFMESLQLEYASLYLHWQNMLEKMKKERGDIPPPMLEQIKMKLTNLTEEVD